MAKTEVILTHNIVGLGGESDQVKVAAGYARNYLFPQGLAIPVSAANKRRLEVLKQRRGEREAQDRKSTRLNSSHTVISYAVFCLKKKKRLTTLASGIEMEAEFKAYGEGQA